MAQMLSKAKYPAVEAAVEDVEAALAEGRRSGTRVILNFGADWCSDCQVLHTYMETRENAKLLAKHFVLAEVNVGMKDANLELARTYGIPLTAIPALSVVEGDGTVVYAQGDEFSTMRQQEASRVMEFLKKWKT
jgi:thiol:disulfide interchange protein